MRSSSCHSSRIHTGDAFLQPTLGRTVKILVIGLATAALVGCSSLSKLQKVFVGQPSPAASKAPTELAKQLTETSAEFALANHLSQTGAKMYGTFWCPYCNRQKQLFQDAVSRLTIIECDPNGANAKPELCSQANVSSYPSWEINGQLYRGMRSLDELAQISGYQGPRNFGS